MNAPIQQANANPVQNLTPDEQSKLERLQEVQARIKIFEKEIEDFQNSKKNKEEIAQKLAEKEKEKLNLDETLDSVASLLEKKSQIETELMKYGDLGKDPTLQEKVNTLKNKKLDKNIEKVKNVTAIKKEILGINSHTEHHFKFIGIPLVILIALQTLITITLYLVSLQTKVILIGLFALVILAIFLAFINILKTKANVYIYDEDKIKNTKVSYQEIDITNPNEESFFLNAAMVNAIKQELAGLDSLITSHLGGKNLDEVKAEKSKVDNEYEQLKQESDKMDSETLTTEEYYKKRREIDILKIEQENIEYSIGSKLPVNLNI